MKKLEKHDRQLLAEKIKIHESNIINELTTRYFSQQRVSQEHRDKKTVHCENDLRDHLTFLRNAIEFGNSETFRHYFQWSTNLLKARNIPHYELATFINDLCKVVDSRLSESEKTMLRAFVLDSSPSEQVSVHQTPPPSESPLKLDQEAFLQALLAGNRQAAKSVAFEALARKYQLIDIYIEVFQKSLYQIGNLWEKNHISVAQEHMATAITQYVIVNIFDHVNPVLINRGKGIVTGVEGEFHQVGAHMVADTLEMQGWDIRFLGVNVPHKSILQIIEEFHPDLVGISATMLSNVPMVRDLIVKIRSQSGSGSMPRILVGGGAFRTLPDIHREIEADGFAQDLQSLLTLV